MKVVFDAGPQPENGRIWWMYDRAPGGSAAFLRDRIPDDQWMDMTLDNKTGVWTVAIPLRSEVSRIEFFSNHSQQVYGHDFYVSSPYTRVSLPQQERTSNDLDYVLTAKILSTHPFRVVWNDLAFGGRGDGPGEFGSGHGIAVSPDKKRIDVADRAKSEIDRFTRYGHYRSTWRIPIGSWPCDIDHSGDLAVVGCLYGPDRSRGAPIYILEKGKVVSTVMIKEELGLEGFQHIHNAVLRKIGERYYIIVQTWNPGDFAILEQVR